jgi:protein-tyrosine phosphatase
LVVDFSNQTSAIISSDEVEMPSVLFVCTANRFRSPIAAALFARHLQEEGLAQDWRVGSAGTWAEPDLPVVPSARWVTDHLGIDLEAHKATRINRELLAQYDLILVMEHNHQEALLIEFPEIKDRLFLFAKVAGGVAYDVPDPGIVQGDTFLDIAKELSDLIDKGFQEICLLAHQCA